MNNKNSLISDMDYVDEDFWNNLENYEFEDVIPNKIIEESKNQTNPTTENDKLDSNPNNNLSIINTNLNPITNLQIKKPQLQSNNLSSEFEENFDVHEYFELYNHLFFEGKLGCILLEWSKRMTSCAGIFYAKQGELIIRLSEPLLKFRSVDEIKETLIHEMIHGWCHIDRLDQSDDRSGHGYNFKSKMYEINKNTGLNITVYHHFHDEVDYYKKHIWRCDGKCKDQAPYFGWVKRAMNRPPGKYDRWFSEHETKCGGKFIKIKNEESKETNLESQINTSREKKKKKETSNIKTLDDFIIKKNNK